MRAVGTTYVVFIVRSVCVLTRILGAGENVVISDVVLKSARLIRKRW